jgi:hypothetical protein
MRSPPTLRRKLRPLTSADGEQRVDAVAADGHLVAGEGDGNRVGVGRAGDGDDAAGA